MIGFAMAPIDYVHPAGISSRMTAFPGGQGVVDSFRAPAHDRPEILIRKILNKPIPSP